MAVNLVVQMAVLMAAKSAVLTAGNWAGYLAASKELPLAALRADLWEVKTAAEWACPKAVRSGPWKAATWGENWAGQMVAWKVSSWAAKKADQMAVSRAVQ